jgi:hypothetical protein
MKSDGNDVVLWQEKDTPREEDIFTFVMHFDEVALLYPCFIVPNGAENSCYKRKVRILEKKLMIQCGARSAIMALPSRYLAPLGSGSRGRHSTGRSACLAWGYRSLLNPISVFTKRVYSNKYHHRIVANPQSFQQRALQVPLLRPYALSSDHDEKIRSYQNRAIVKSLPSHLADFMLASLKTPSTGRAS